MKINRNSWHAWIINKFSDRNPWEYDDICSYTRVLLLSTLLMLFLFSLAVGALFVIGGGLVGLAILVLKGSSHLSSMLGAFFAIDCIIVFIISLHFFVEWIKDVLTERKYRRAANPPKVKKPGFIKTAYRAWKDKYCIKLDWTE